MRTTILAAGFVLGSAIALPHDHHDPGHHGKHHGVPSLTGFPPIGTGTAPLGTGTGIANATGGLFHALPVSGSHDLENALEGLNVPKTGQAVPTAAAAIEDKHDSSGGDDCNAATVTVTSNSIVTVTVDGSGSGPAASSASPVKNVAPSPIGPAKGTTLPSTDTDDTAPLAAPSKSSTPKAATQQPSGNTQQSPASNEEATPAKPASSSAAPATQSATPDDTTDNTTTAPATGGGSTGALAFKTKRGIIASGSSSEQLAAAFANTKLSWLGNWYSGPPHSLPASLTFVPQNYGKQSDINGEWTKNAQQAVAKGDKYFLSFGEPGTPNDKLHMEPAEAVQLWRDKMEPFAKQGVTIGAPGTLQNTQDFDWLNKFIDACTGCSIGFIALHWFDKAGAAQVPGFKETVGKAKVIADKIGKPVWVDNFSADGDAAAQKEFLGEVVPWLEQQSYVQAYGYVPPEVGKAGAGGNMIGGDGKLNDLGQYYATL
ncbi:uncharacterized protein KY384_007512 [Bacidia gigantensis]|uniref:uncharacterized protein n=1 Tax=Bacidia gigantensis TaxID=2732470 RepID=UPI001D051E43|nr:uncharacterized protein KY384_007512 [Bacidia gigantensis]KAG8527360.1 hypothetical protein KY384_007512 [Bacidia gigantensis]